MPPVKKIKLPPKPVVKPRPVASTTSTITSSAKDPRNISDLKAVSYVITLEDGTYLRADGAHADLIYRYLNQCERFCAEQQQVNYLGPSLIRYDAQGNKMAQGVDVKSASAYGL